MPKEILYIDDEPHLTKALVEALTDEGYSVRKSKNGKDAIQKINQLQPDLIVQDLIMPTTLNDSERVAKMEEGLLLHKKIRGELKLKIPMVFVTVVRDIDIHALIKKLENKHNISDVNILTKPVRPSELLRIVKRLLP